MKSICPASQSKLRGKAFGLFFEPTRTHASARTHTHAHTHTLSLSLLHTQHTHSAVRAAGRRIRRLSGRRLGRALVSSFFADGPARSSPRLAAGRTLQRPMPAMAAAPATSARVLVRRGGNGGTGYRGAPLPGLTASPRLAGPEAATLPLPPPGPPVAPPVSGAPRRIRRGLGDSGRRPGGGPTSAQQRA